ncbi:MAG: FliH/SctL family protein [Phycisphaerales bacterium]|nr:FliH/SctL family protein [Phycisphaerales bacterium]
MGLIKRADIEEYTRDSYVMDLSDLEKRGRAVIDAANTQAQKILQDAQSERDRLISTAEKAGFEKGFKEGHEKGFVDGSSKGVEEARNAQTELLNQLSGMWINQLDSFETQRDSMIEEARTQMIELAVMIATRVTRRVIELDGSIVLSQIDAALSSITESSRLVLRVHPEDAEVARCEVPKMIDRFASCEHAQVIADDSVTRGSCVAQSASGGVIDASIPTQLDRIINALLPSRTITESSSELLEFNSNEELPDIESESTQSIDDSLEENQPQDDAA